MFLSLTLCRHALWKSLRHPMHSVAVPLIRFPHRAHFCSIALLPIPRPILHLCHPCRNFAAANQTTSSDGCRSPNPLKVGPFDIFPYGCPASRKSLASLPCLAVRSPNHTVDTVPEEWYESGTLDEAARSRYYTRAARGWLSSPMGAFSACPPG